MSEISLSFGRSVRRFLSSWQLPLRLGIIGTVLILITLAAYKGSLNQLRFLAIISPMIGGGLLFFRRPELGLVLLPVVGMSIKFVGPSNINLSLVLTAMLLLLWLFKIINHQEGVYLVSSPTMRSVIALVLVSIVSFLAGQLTWFQSTPNAPLDAQLGGLAIFLLSVGAFVLAANQFKKLYWLKAMTWIFLALGALFVFGRVFPVLIPIIKVVFAGQAIGGVFWAWLPALAFGQAVFNRDLRPEWRLALGVVVALTLYAGFVLNSQWKSGWLPSFAAVWVIVFLWNWRIGLGTALAAIFSWQILAPDLLATDSYSISTRFDAWFIMLAIIQVSPIFGLGFGNYYWYTPLFQIRGWTVQFNSHNNYIDIIAQTGIMGIVCFLWFFWEVGRVGFKLRNRVTDQFARAYVYGALGGLVGTLVAAMLGDWVLSFVYNIGFHGFRTGVLAWLFLGGLVAIAEMYADNPVKMVV